MKKKLVFPLGWRPSVSVSPPSLSAAGDYCKERISAGYNGAREAATSLRDDLLDIFGAASECGRAVADAHQQIFHRHLDQAKRATREILDPMLQWLASAIFPERPPKTKFWLLKNPRDAFHKNIQADFEELVFSETSHHEFEKTIVFVH